MELQIKRVEDCFNWLSNEFGSTEEFRTQNLQELIDRLNNLCNILPFINGQMAYSKKLLNEAKVRQYRTLITSSTANQKYFSVSQGKDYVNSLCSEENYAYDIAERASRTIIHLMDALRTAISALKTEMQTMSYSQNVPR